MITIQNMIMNLKKSRISPCEKGECILHSKTCMVLPKQLLRDLVLTLDMSAPMILSF